MHTYTVWVHDPTFHAANQWACTAECDLERQAKVVAAEEHSYYPRMYVEVYKLIGPGRYKLVHAISATELLNYPAPDSAIFV